MSLATDIASAASEVGRSAQLADAQAQIQALIDAGSVDSIEAAPVAEPPVV